MTQLLVAGLVVFPSTKDDDGVGVSAQPFNYLIWAKEKPRQASATPAGRKPKITCSYRRWWYVNGLKKVGSAESDHALSTERPDEGAWYEVRCSDGYRDVVWIKNRQSPRAVREQLARRAYERIPITPPKVLTAPPRGQDGLVGLPHWFYLDEGQWAAKSKRLHAGAIWAEATATPQRMTIDTGDDRTLTCDGPGVAYDASRPAALQRSTCSHRYLQPARARQVTVSVTWRGTWRGSGGEGGALPPITRSVTFPIRVVEAQALVTKG
jgi:hypothetical protein